MCSTDGTYFLPKFQTRNNYLITWLMQRMTGSSLFDKRAWRTCITMLTQIMSLDDVIIRTVIMHPISCRDLITATNFF